MRMLTTIVFVLGFSLTSAQDSTAFSAGRIYLFDKVVFGVGQSGLDLEEGDLRQLTQLAIAMKKMPGMKIQVMAHTDVIGSPKLNKKLSRERAENIRNYLVGVGVERFRIETLGYGSEMPLYRESNPKNRRIEIKITENPHPVSVVTKLSQPASQPPSEPSPVQSKYKKELNKIALVIGNATYENVGKLKNPTNDVDLMTKTLSTLGFKVSSYKNLSISKMKDAIRAFATEVDKADVIFFYYAGHGMQHQGNNYLLPIDAALKNGPLDLQFEAIKADIILNVLEYTNKDCLNIIVLDACRNNPFSTATRGSVAGLAEIKPPSGSLIAFATSPGAYAFDGTGANGVYTEALADELLKPQRLEDVFMNTRIRVEQKTDGAQSPWELFKLRAAYQLKD